MNPLTWFGDWHTWILLFAVWLSLGSLLALALGLITRVGAWKGDSNPQEKGAHNDLS